MAKWPFIAKCQPPTMNAMGSKVIIQPCTINVAWTKLQQPNFHFKGCHETSNFSTKLGCHEISHATKFQKLKFACFLNHHAECTCLNNLCAEFLLRLLFLYFS
ncbi:hypothetical protein SLEP1_g40979 [Rubroshorea leprosula]|uniref:Uncharacterized protein n=1 Tax=Rubroshorea leprosula TaxID=152421 RepID=A0AAV5L524_9ROSI|nr:hypothetical protein SLEP1_g40979 [Rubroshorea leprosula]